MKITAAESLVMDVLWRTDEPVAVEDIRAARPGEDWTDGTIRKLLSRLEHKKAVASIKDGRRFVYRPLVQRADYLHAESKSLIDRLFDGQLEPFVAHFSEREDLSEAELAKLRELIGRLGRDK